MELFKSLEKRTKLFSEPFKHFEINEPLTQNAIDEICSAFRRGRLQDQERFHTVKWMQKTGSKQIAV